MSSRNSIKDDPTRLVLVDIESLTIEVPEAGWRKSFFLDPMTQERLVEGWDDIGLSLRRADEITDYEATSTAPSLDGVFDANGHAVRS